MNPHQARPTRLKELLASQWRNRQLILQMTKREVVGRYRGSVMGLAWSFFNPLIMLTVYTFVFSVVFKARWGLNGGEDKASFAIFLFVGMIVHGLFAECVNRAPGLILSNANYVKSVPQSGAGFFNCGMYEGTCFTGSDPSLIIAAREVGCWGYR